MTREPLHVVGASRRTAVQICLTASALLMAASVTHLGSAHPLAQSQTDQSSVSRMASSSNQATSAAPPARPTTAPPASTPPSTPPSPATPALPGSVQVLPALPTDPKLLELLDGLEHAADGLKQFDAKIAYEKFDGLTGSEFRYGTIVYDRAEAATRLGVFFDEWIDSNGRSEKLQQRFVFAGGWLAEIDDSRRQFIKRQIVPPGQTFDPLKLGEGPFPLPVGQKRAEVLARFDVVAAPTPSAGLLKSIDAAAIASGKVKAMRLIPKAGTPEANDFATVDLYYDAATLLPVGVVAEAPEGNIKRVRLTALRRNQALPPDVVKALSIESPPPGEWMVDVRPWKP